MTRPRLSGDRGQVGGIEVLPLGLLVLVVGTLLLANAWAVVDAHLAAGEASRAAVRRVAEATDAGSVEHDATTAARAALDGLGRDPDRLSVEVGLDGRFARCTRATVRVRTSVDALHLPFIGGFGPTFDVTAVATEVVDPLREGLDGAAHCIR